MSNSKIINRCLRESVRFLRILLIFSVAICLASGCHRSNTVLINIGIDSVISSWVPDSREGIFKAALHSENGAFVLKGETDIQGAKQALISFLENKEVAFIDSLQVLPDTTIIKKPWGLVNVSVCNLRAGRTYSSELVSQALMETPVRILKKITGWVFVQTPDRYLGWIDSDAVFDLTERDYDIWRSSERIFYTGKTGDIYADPDFKKVISDIVAGCIAVKTGEQGNLIQVILPDGREGFIQEESCIPLDQLTTETFLSSGNLVSVAESFTGIPYLWGGTSVKGFDCSGFVKTVYFLNGIILARDASLQFRHGIEIDKSGYPDSLKPGDLLFFGSVRDGKPKATHVGMYIGNTEFIHDAGMVKVNSLDSTRNNFSRYRRDTFLGVRRIIGAGTGKGIQRIQDHDWYKKTNK